MHINVEYLAPKSVYQQIMMDTPLPAPVSTMRLKKSLAKVQRGEREFAAPPRKADAKPVTIVDVSDTL